MPIIIEKQNTCYSTNGDNTNQKQYIYWQAHQSTSTVMPENTIAAFMYTWNLGGIPEADIRTTKDGVIISMHDATPERTTDAPESQKKLPVSSFTLEQVKKWDAGIKTSELYKGEKIPALKEAFELMKQEKDRLLYLDLKEVDLDSLGNLINEYGVNKQIIFTHYKEENCRQMYETVNDIRTMLWLGGRPEKIKDKFNKVLGENFYGLNQIQIHLNDKENITSNEWRYQIDKEFLEYAYDKTSSAGLDLEVLPFEFDDKSLHALLDMGIRWFAVDYPEEFIDSVKKWGERT